MPRRRIKKETDTNKKIQNKAAIYCRVSTEEQGDSRLGLDEQERRCKDICRGRNWQVFDIYTEIAPANSFKRDQLQMLLADARQKNFEIIIALRLDRISRVLRDFYYLVDKLDELGIDIATAEYDIGTTTSQGKMLRGVLIQFAAFERDMISERTIDALHQKALRGEHRGGLPPFGYDVVNKKYQINNKEARIVKDIFQKYIKGVGPSKIASDLNSKGICTKKHITKKDKVIGGVRFTKSKINDMINNYFYTGLILVRDKTKGKDEFKYINGQHEAIIDERTFKRAELMVEENANLKNLGKSVRGQMLLNGIIKCGFCDRYMTTASGKSRGKTYYYYRCTKSNIEGTRACLSNQIKKEDIEQLTIEVIKKVASDKKFLDRTIAMLEESNEDEIQDKYSDVNELIVTKRELKQRQRNLVLLINEQKLNDIKVITQELRDLEKQIDEIESKEKEIKEEIKLLKTKVIDSKELYNLYRGLYDIWNSLDRADQRNLAQLIIKEINIKIPKASKEGEIIFTLWTDIPQWVLTEYKIGSSFCKVSLPSSVLNSNFFIAEFPLNLGQRRHKINTKKIKKRISRYELALRYQKMVNDPRIGTRAALARKLGVSRAWVTMVMRELKS